MAIPAAQAIRSKSTHTRTLRASGFPLLSLLRVHGMHYASGKK